MVRDKLEPYESRGSRTVLRGGGRRKASSLPDHPGDSAAPSSTDEATFARVFGKADWAVMFILARGGATYARLRFRAGPGGQLRIPVEVDFSRDFTASDQAAWNREYQENVRMPPLELPFSTQKPQREELFDPSSWDEIEQRWLDLDDPSFLREEFS